MARQVFPRAAGVVIPLFSLRGPHDAGNGSMLDAIDTLSWLAEWHQAVLQILPINETRPDENSPYDTLSAFAIDPTYICAWRVPEIERSAAAHTWLRSAPIARELRRARAASDRQRDIASSVTAHLLELGYTEFESQPVPERVRHFDAYCRENAWWLDEYALFRALKEERNEASWEVWPVELRTRRATALQHAAERLSHRMRFFRFVQWVAAEQWAAVRRAARQCGVLLKGDLPFVCGRDSADVWAHQDLFDLSSSAGAPPDAFSPTGQAWGLPLYNWDALRTSGYQWWRNRVRQASALYDIIRVDHVVGLYRTYAIPMQPGGTAGFVPPDESTQRVQGSELMHAILEDAGETAIVAEDLGSVPAWVRQSLTQLAVPGYKVLRWERSDEGYLEPRDFPALSVATSGTHDTDTLVTWWSELSAAERVAVLGPVAVSHSQTPTAQSLPWSDVHDNILERLYAGGSALTILPIQDLLGWSERINTPGTVDPRNWAFRLPTQTHQLTESQPVRLQLQRIRAMIDASGRYGGP